MNVECEVYSRCSGYFRPVNQWNIGKQSEFEERRGLKYEQSKPAVEPWIVEESV